MNNLSTQHSERVRGFTLIELMIVVAIIAIIATLAYPSYIRQVHKAGRTDATSALLVIAAEQEKEFLKNNAYTSELDDLGITETEAGKYKLTLTTPDGGFLAVAAPNTPGNVSQVDDKGCAEFSIDHTGAKRSEGVDASGGAVTTGCW